jgi:hypothetical protein
MPRKGNIILTIAFVSGMFSYTFFCSVINLLADMLQKLPFYYYFLSRWLRLVYFFYFFFAFYLVIIEKQNDGSINLSSHNEKILAAVEM